MSVSLKNLKYCTNCKMLGGSNSFIDEDTICMICSKNRDIEERYDNLLKIIEKENNGIDDLEKKINKIDSQAEEKTACWNEVVRNVVNAEIKLVNDRVLTVENNMKIQAEEDGEKLKRKNNIE